MMGRTEAKEWSSSFEGVSDSEACLEDSKDEELFYETSSLAKLQFRKDVLKACWKNEMGMAEVIEHKGRMLTSMGIVRNGKTYCFIEETLFLAEIGALLLVDDKDTAIPLIEIYEKVAEGKGGCTWEGFEVYRHLKSLGYILGRHGIQWRLKSVWSCSIPLEDPSEKENIVRTVLDKNSIVKLLNDLQIREHKPVFEVYPPNSNFSKTSPGDPNFVVYLARSNPPLRLEMEELESQCNGVPLRIGHVDHGRVSFFSLDKVELPVLA